jgi:D-arabinose 1-dehydrogenase-like Zn-dependent alcohol dehydrogenase
MPKMRAVQVPKAGGPLETVEREIPVPGPGFVRVRVEACGICHSDALTKEGQWPGIQYPRVPGHEIAGVVDAVGPDVPAWKPGDRVGIGWHGWNCGYCDSCRRGDFLLCRLGNRVPGIAFDGGYEDYVVAPSGALARIPVELTAAEAAPLMCAGVTTFNSLRHAGAIPGDLVAVLGIGGLGHLGVQFASKMGFDTVAIARGRDKEPLARELGARLYIDSQEQDPAAELTKLGGARVILATVTNAAAMAAVLGGLGIDGKLLIRRRPARSPPGASRAPHWRTPLDRRLALRPLDRLPGHDGLRSTDRSAIQERALPPRPRRRGVRQDDERRGPLPRGTDDLEG